MSQESNRDSKRLDFLQSLTDQKRYSGKVVLRDSITGRGWRLHESSEGYDTVREAIDAYMKENSLMICAGCEIIPVVSSTIKSIGYDEETESIKSRLTVIFAGGARWVYAGVPREVWERFKEAESVGRFFAREIKPVFPGVKQ